MERPAEVVLPPTVPGTAAPPPRAPTALPADVALPEENAGTPVREAEATRPKQRTAKKPVRSAPATERRGRSRFTLTRRIGRLENHPLTTHPLTVIAVALLALGIGACRQRPAVSDPAGAQPAAQLIRLEAPPPPGAKQLLAVGDPQLKRACERAQQRFLWIDKMEVVPRACGRFTYTFCPEVPVQQLRGTLTTRVSFQGRTLITDRDDRYTLRPGQWAVDARIVIPPAAQSGTYSLETAFVASGAAFNRAADFSVY